MSLSLTFHRWLPAARRQPDPGPTPTAWRLAPRSAVAVPATGPAAGGCSPPAADRQAVAADPAPDTSPRPSPQPTFWRRWFQPAPRPLADLSDALLCDLGAPDELRALAAARQAQREQAREWLRMGVLPHGAPW